MKLIGLSEFNKAISRFGEKKVKGVIKELNLAGVNIVSHAKESIQSHNSSYKQYKRGKRGEHSSSRPGDPPNSDTGLLAASLNARVHVAKGRAILYAGIWSKKTSKYSKIPVVRYAKWLEYGTKNTAKRPFMKPAFMVQGKKAKKRLAKELAK